MICDLFITSMGVGLSDIYDWRSAIYINFSGGRDVLKRLSVIHDLRSAFCNYFSKVEGYW